MHRFNSMMSYVSGPGHKRTQSVQSTEPKSRKRIGVEHQRNVSISQPLSNQTLAHHAKTGGGSGLPDSLQKQWGPRLGQDLSRFRIHTNNATADIVRKSGANAINYGNHLFFANGAYNPTTTAGQTLIGHEIAHGLQSKAVNSYSAAIPRHNPTLECEANQVGSALAGTDGPINMSNIASASPALRGDKQIAFTGSTITVTDTYVIYGPAANNAYVSKFQNALDQYYNNPSFTYRGYTVSFNLRVRMKQVVTRTAGLFDWQSTDWSSDTDTSMFNVESGSGTAGGIGTIILYEMSSKGTIAHEVGHYLSDRIGYFSEGYSEGVVSRIRGLLNMGGRTNGVKPGAAGDIMTTLTGTVGNFSLSGILDSAIYSHENPHPRYEKVMP